MPQRATVSYLVSAALLVSAIALWVPQPAAAGVINCFGTVTAVHQDRAGYVLATVILEGTNAKVRWVVCKADASSTSAVGPPECNNYLTLLLIANTTGLRTFFQVDDTWPTCELVPQWTGVTANSFARIKIETQ